MNKTNGFAGFGKQNHKEDNQYIGKFVQVSQNGNSVLGVLENLDFFERCAYFRSSIVGDAKETLHLMSDLPTKMDFPLTIIRPIPGTPEEYVRDYNKLKHHKKQKGKK